MIGLTRIVVMLALCVMCTTGATAQLPPKPLPETSPVADPAWNDEQNAIVDFLETGYLQAWFAHPASVRRHFADPVENYWGRRNVALNSVVREKLGYARKWIFRFYKLDRASLRFAPVEGRPRTWTVSFGYEFLADRVPERSAGRGETTLVVSVDGDLVKIHAETGRVLERQRSLANRSEP